MFDTLSNFSSRYTSLFTTHTHEHSRKLAYKTVLFIPNQHRVCELSILCDKVPEQANPTHQIQKQKQNKSKQITSIN